MSAILERTRYPEIFLDPVSIAGRIGVSRPRVVRRTWSRAR